MKKKLLREFKGVNKEATLFELVELYRMAGIEDFDDNDQPENLYEVRIWNSG